MKGQTTEWISVKDRLPEKEGRYFVKIIRGSMVKKEVERESLFKLKGFPRFIIGDWETVTHWKPQQYKG